jgi:hypothetical protein
VYECTIHCRAWQEEGRWWLLEGRLLEKQLLVLGLQQLRTALFNNQQPPFPHNSFPIPSVPWYNLDTNQTRSSDIMTIELDEVLRALELNNPYLSFYLDTETGKISVVSSLSDDSSNNPAADTEKSIKLPAAKDLDMMKMMKEFLPFMKNPQQRAAIAASLDAGHSLKELEEELADMDMRQNWYTFQNMKYRDCAMDWCRTHHIEYK